MKIWKLKELWGIKEKLIGNMKWWNWSNNKNFWREKVCIIYIFFWDFLKLIYELKKS